MEKKRSIIKLLAVLLAVAAFATAGFLLGRFLPNKDRDKTNAALEHVGRAVEIQCGAKTGTGFIYESDGETATVLTCYHVVKGDAKSARFRFYGDSAFKYAEKTLGFDENADLAVFKVKTTAVYKKMAVKQADTGDSVTLFGNSSGKGIEAYFGKVSVQSTVIECEDEAGSFLDGKFMPAVGVNAAINAGSSGCMVADEEGNLVGMGFYQHFGTPERPVIDQSYMIPANLVAALVRTYEEGSKTVEKLDYSLFNGYKGEGENLCRVTETAFKNHGQWSGKVFRERNGAVYYCDPTDDYASGGAKVLALGGICPKNTSELLAAATLYHYFGGNFITE